MKTYMPSKFSIERDSSRCIQCQVCVNQCSFDVHYYDAVDDEVRSRERNCVACHRCVVFCPTGAATIKKNPLYYQENYDWRPEVIEDVIKQSETGGALLISMDNDKGAHILEHRFVKLFPLYLHLYSRLDAY